MTGIEFDGYRAEITRQAGLLNAAIAGQDMTTRVPTCPDWNVGQLIRHVGGALNWTTTVARERATGPVPDDFRDLSAFTDEDASVLGPWLESVAERLGAQLREVGPGYPLWSPVGAGGSDFHARRMAHEILVHRADAELALGREFTAVPVIAADAIDEWMFLGSMPFLFEVDPSKRELLGAGRTVRLSATDTEAGWLIDLTGDAITWSRDTAGPDPLVTLRGPVTELLLVVYRRKALPDTTIGVSGDRDFLDFWLDRIAFG